MSDPETAWRSLRKALPAGWTLELARLEVDTGRWSITAHPPNRRSSAGLPIPAVTGTGRSRTSAVRDLTAKLRVGGPRGTIGD